MRYIPALLMIGLLAGCARYEFDVMAPPQAAGHVGRRTVHQFTVEPLDYRLRTVDNRLVMDVHNPSEQNVTLLGARSSVVDPRGQSHPLQTQTIAPDSFIRLILPPQRPRVYRGGPTFGVGVGTRIGAAHHRYHGHALAGHGGPRYLAVYDDSDAIYWDWPGEGQARLNLVFTRGDTDDPRAATFTHNFVIRRIRAR